MPAERAHGPDAAQSAGQAQPARYEPALYEQIFQAMSDALLVVDMGGTIRMANQRGEALFGYPLSELVGRRIEDLIPQRFREAHVQYRNRYGAKPQTRPMGLNLALSARHSDGHEFAVEISLSPVRLGDQTMICANVRDVGDLRRAQDLIVRARQSNAVADFGRLALASKDPGQIQQQACSLIEGHLGVDFALAARCDRDARGLRATASAGFDEIALEATLERLARRLDEPGSSSIDRC